MGKGKPGRVLESELAVAEPEKSGGKLDEIGGTSGEDGAEMGGDESDADVDVMGMPSL